MRIGIMASVLAMGMISSDPTLALDLNFLASSLPAGMTFSRASSATDIINGVLTTFASGSPRISTANGYLGEPARTNLVLYNSSSATTGTLTGSQTDPAGASLAYLYTEGSTSSGWQWSTGASTISFVSGTTYTASAFVKAGTLDRVQMFTSSSITGANGYANYYLSGDGSVSKLGAGYSSAGIKRLGSTAWYRIWATFTCTGTASHTLTFSSISTGTETRAPSILGTSRTIYWFGPQVESAAAISSYIPTTTAAVTRAADQLYYDFSSPVAAPNTVYCHAVAPPWESSVLAGSVVETKAVSAGDRIIIGRVSYDTKINTKCQIGYANQCDLFASSVVGASVEFKSAFSNATNSFRGATKGTVSVEDTVGTAPAINRIYICGDSGGTATNFFGYVKAARVYNVAKTQSELEAVTAL